MSFQRKGRVYADEMIGEVWHSGRSSYEILVKNHSIERKINICMDE